MHYKGRDPVLCALVRRSIRAGTTSVAPARWPSGWRWSLTPAVAARGSGGRLTGSHRLGGRGWRVLHLRGRGGRLGLQLSFDSRNELVLRTPLEVEGPRTGLQFRLGKPAEPVQPRQVRRHLWEDTGIVQLVSLGEPAAADAHHA